MPKKLTFKAVLARIDTSLMSDSQAEAYENETNVYVIKEWSPGILIANPWENAEAVVIPLANVLEIGEKEGIQYIKYIDPINGFNEQGYDELEIASYFIIR